jgi:hypothetical protein
VGDLVNLKRFRKRTERGQAEREAEANRVKFGRTRAERALSERNKQTQERVLDAHLRDKQSRESGEDT